MSSRKSRSSAKAAAPPPPDVSAAVLELTGTVAPTGAAPPPPCRCADYAEMHEENARLKLLLDNAHEAVRALRARAIDDAIPDDIVERVKGHARILHAHRANTTNGRN